MPSTPYGNPEQPCCTGDAEKRTAQKQSTKDTALNQALGRNLVNNGGEKSSLMRTVNDRVLGTVAHSTKQYQR